MRCLYTSAPSEGHSLSRAMFAEWLPSRVNRTPQGRKPRGWSDFSRTTAPLQTSSREITRSEHTWIKNGPSPATLKPLQTARGCMASSQSASPEGRVFRAGFQTYSRIPACLRYTSCHLQALYT